MSDRSAIEWTDASWNPIRARNLKTGRIGWHCEHVSPGCERCYAESINKRLGTGLPFKPGHRKDVEIFLDAEMLLAPLRWKRPRKIFVGSMTDLFADFVTDDMLDRIFAVMALAPQHTFQVLTKRAELMLQWFRSSGHSDDRFMDVVGYAYEIGGMEKPNGELLASDTEILSIRWPLPNVWLGVSCERQEEADERIPLLLQTPAAVRFISAEPLLGPLDLRRYLIGHEDNGIAPGRPVGTCIGWTPPLDWVIAGGESGRSARPMHPAWAGTLRDQCQADGAAFFFKQWGEWLPSTERRLPWNCEHVTVCFDGRVREWDDDYPSSRLTDPNMRVMLRVGKKAAGRLLDGREHDAFPDDIADREAAE